MTELSMPQKRELRALPDLLFLAGCDISKADSRGRTPLHIVNAAGDDGMVKLRSYAGLFHGCSSYAIPKYTVRWLSIEFIGNLIIVLVV